MRSHAASIPLAARVRRACGHRGILPVLVIPFVVVALTGCASNGNNYQSSGVTRHAAVQPPLPRPKPEIEDDGRPVQAPPARIMRPDEDDPTQPWSPNYGRARGDAARVTEVRPHLPARHTLRSPESDVHPAHARPMTEDEIVARAVAQHEMAAQQRR